MGKARKTLEGVGERVYALRLRRAMTQKELAEAAGVSVDGLTKIENGYRTPRPGTVRRLAKALRVPVERITIGE